MNTKHVCANTMRHLNELDEEMSILDYIILNNTIIKII